MSKRCTTLEITDEQVSADQATLAAAVTLVNDIRSKLKGDYLITKAGLAIGTTKPNVATAALDYIINGVQYSKAAVTAGTALSGDNIPQSTYGAWALEINAAGTISIVEAAANATGYASAALAIAGLPATSADKARLGWVTATKSDAVFDPGTTNLDDASTTDTYTDAETAFEAIGAAVS